MPANKPIKFSFRSFFSKTPKKDISFEKDLQVAPASRHALTVPRSEKIESEVTLIDAFHDPSILDIRRNLTFGLNTIVVEINKFSAIGQPTFTKFNSCLPPTFSTTHISPVGGLYFNKLDPRCQAELPSTSRVITLKDLRVMRFLGRGMSGQVYSTQDTMTRERRALKVVSHAGMLKETTDGLLKELTIMKNMENGPYLMGVDASFHDTKNFYFVMPLCPTDVESELDKFERFSKDRARFYFAETLIALNYLHEAGIVHRDIKPANLLIDREGHIVVADFGLAHDFGQKPTIAERVYQPFWQYARGDTVIAPETKRPYGDPELHFALDRVCGTGLYMSPDVIRGKGYSFGVDIWALGVCLYVMMTGRAPFYSDSPDFEDQMNEILCTEVEYAEDDKVDEVTQDFIGKLLEKNPLDRLLTSDIEAHPFFEHLNWPLMEKRAIPAPWVPKYHTGHVVEDVPPVFVPGVPFDGAAPYAEFDYTSEGIKSGTIREGDLTREGSEGWNDDDDKAEVKKAGIGAFFGRWFGTKSSTSKAIGLSEASKSPTTSTSLVSSPLPPPSPLSSSVLWPSLVPSSSSAPWLAINLSEEQPLPEPDLQIHEQYMGNTSDIIPRPTSVAIASKPKDQDDFFGKIRRWFKRLWSSILPNSCVPTAVCLAI